MKAFLQFDCRYRYRSGFQLEVDFAMGDRVTALHGPSGSGKTTILSLIAGLLKPDRGRIEVGDRLVLDTDTGCCLPPQQRRIGMLFQEQRLFPHMRVKDNLSYGRKRRGDVGVDMDRVLDAMELGDVMERFPQTLSGGQQQRVALARALACAPQLLLLDEPLTAVEPELRERIVSMLERVTEQFKIPTLLVSHNRALVDRLATRTLCISQGRIVDC